MTYPPVRSRPAMPPPGRGAGVGAGVAAVVGLADPGDEGAGEAAGPDGSAGAEVPDPADTC